MQKAGGEYPTPDQRGPIPQNAHPDATFSSHLHNDWTHVQLNSDIERSAEPLTPWKHAYEGETIDDQRLYDNEEFGDY
jgi:hypothetical protein